MTDEELMQAYTAGDNEAFQELYKRHNGRVLGYLRSKLSSQNEAEDVFQEVFAKLHKYRFKYTSSIPFLAWFFTIVRNTLVDHIRKQKTQSKHIQVDSSLLIDVVDNQDVDIPISDILEELAGLTENQRQILELRFNEGLTFEDIAVRMNVSYPNARKLASRAIQKLRKMVASKRGYDDEA